MNFSFKKTPKIKSQVNYLNLIFFLIQEQILTPKTLGDSETKSNNKANNFPLLLIILPAIAIVSLILIIVLAFIFKRKYRVKSSKKNNYEKVNQNDASINSVKAQVPDEII